MDLIAYTLREEFAGTVEQETTDGVVDVPRYSGGVIRAGELDIDVPEELLAGDGYIVIDARSQSAAVHLDEYPPLMRVAVPDVHTRPTGAFIAAGPYDLANVTELRGDAATRGIEGTGRAKREDLVDALEEHDERLAAGSLDELGAPLTVARLAQSRRGEDVEPAPSPPSPTATDGVIVESTEGE